MFFFSVLRLQILLDYGLRIHEPSLKNQMDESASEVDDLLKSVGTLEVYKALASEAYVSQAYSDPVDRSFELGVILHKLSMVRTWYLIYSLLLNDSITEIVSDSINIFLWHESEDISKKYISKKIQLILILRFQVMIMCVSSLPQTTVLHKVSCTRLSVKIALISWWFQPNFFKEVSFLEESYKYMKKKIKYLKFWERPLFDIREYAFNDYLSI